jgi:hypothetical protein
MTSPRIEPGAWLDSAVALVQPGRELAVNLLTYRTVRGDRRAQPRQCRTACSRGGERFCSMERGSPVRCDRSRVCHARNRLLWTAREVGVVRQGARRIRSAHADGAR